jgi:casein kinase 1
VFFYFLRGQLPWQGLKAPTNKQKYEKIGEKKRSTNVNDLCSNLPPQFAQYLETVRNLNFEETPNYEGYRNLLISALDDIGETCDGEYDWMKLNGGKGWDLSINKKPNLHGYGHPNPPNEKDRHHRSNQQRRNRHLQQQIQQSQSQQYQAQQQAYQQAQQQVIQTQESKHQQQTSLQNGSGLNNTSNALNQQQFQNNQPVPIREQVHSQNTFENGRQNQINQQLDEFDESHKSKKGFFSKLLCCS